MEQKRKTPVNVPPPLVTFREENAGPKTLAAIAEARAEALHPYAHRGPARTKHYGDRISNAPGAVSPLTSRALDDAPELSVVPHRPGQDTAALLAHEWDDSPEISVAEYRPSLQTYALIEEEARHAGPDIEVSCPPSSPPTDSPNIYGLEIEQVHTFSVRCSAQYFRSAQDRRRLVDGRLLRAMPGIGLDDVTRVEIEEAGPKLMLVRVYSKVEV